MIRSTNSPSACLAVWWAMLTGLAGAPAAALNILVTNDDGVEASTIHALYRALQAHGDQVIVVSETQDNSGKGGAADFFKPIGPLKQDSRSGAVKAGSPGVGTVPGHPDVYYVDSTPVAATLYGIDIVAPARWGGRPDLVISGPNYGNNTGMVNNSSGTVNAALIAINRGIPAVAVSAATPRSYKSFERLSPMDPEFEDAALVVRLVAALDRFAGQARAAGPRQALLPPGVGLNMNIPAFAAGTSGRLTFRLSHEGTASIATPVFVADLSEDTGARVLGIPGLPALPGISVVWADAAASSHAAGAKADPTSEQRVLESGAVAISVIRGNHEAGVQETAATARRLGGLLSTGRP